MVNWRVGCSGFHYKHWKDAFYPNGLAQTKWFDYYCRHFNTLELNVTFYRFPQLSTLEGWYRKSPDSFIFSVKAPRLITHFKKFIDTQKLVTQFYDVIREGLKNKLGVALFQLPPSYSYNEQRLGNIISNLNPDVASVVEFRHISWWHTYVYNTLTKNKIIFGGMSHPSLPAGIVENTTKLYYRFHGVPHLYSSEYDKNSLKKFCDDVTDSGKTNEAYIYFNNDIGGSAIRNAQVMKNYCHLFIPPVNFL